MARRIKIAICVWLMAGAAYGQQINRYVVFFKDKSNTSYSISQPLQFLSQRAIDRRTRQGISVSEEDLPVNSNYINEIKAKGASTYFSSKWMNAVLIETDESTLAQIKSLSFVDHTEYVAPNKKLGGRIKKVRSKKESSLAPATQTQLQMLSLDAMQADGFKGEGIHLAVFDGGFSGVDTAIPFQLMFQENRLIDSYDFVRKSTNVYAYDDHGTEVLSVIGAFSEGNYTGGAYKANFHLYITEDSDTEYRIEEYNWLFAAERADSAGVDVINTSLGYNTFDDSSMDYSKLNLDGKTAVISKAASKVIAKGIVVVCSAGNEGNNSWQLVTPPADVDGILAIGSVTSTNTKSTFSSIGPTSDNRFKPDVVALGSGTSIIKPNGSIGTQNGTSVASPLIASLAAGVLQAYPQLSAREVYETIIRSADQYLQPDNRKGYGLPRYSAIINFLETSELNDEIVLYPNPVTGSSVKIAIKNPSQQLTHIQVFAVDGKKLSEQQILINWQNNPVEYDLSALASGVYLIKVKSADHVKIARVMKQ